jgi:hypothetical protein
MLATQENTASNGRMIINNELGNMRKESGHILVWGIVPTLSWKPRGISENFHQDSWCHCSDSNCHLLNVSEALPVIFLTNVAGFFSQEGK